MHTEKRIGESKAKSAALALREQVPFLQDQAQLLTHIGYRLNSSICVKVHPVALTPQNAREILSQYDIILDCTDNAPTRYLLSDTAVALGKPLVSGAAMKYDGQLCTYNLQPDGPCYRCIFPKPPVPELVRTCEDSGVLGVVTGIVGSLQALQAVKLITGQHGDSLSEFPTRITHSLCTEKSASLLLFSALSMPPFQSVKLRQKKAQCPACGREGENKIPIEETDYITLCGGKKPDWEALGLQPGEKGERMTPSVRLCKSSPQKNDLRV